MTRSGGQTLIEAAGDLAYRFASELTSLLAHLDPNQHPSVTLDLRSATALHPLVVHALLHAWERRGRRFGSIRLLLRPGGVSRYVDGLGLHHALDCVHEGETDLHLPVLSLEETQKAMEGTLGHYQHLLDAAGQHDFPALERAARAAHPLCVAAGAEPGATAFGEWCERCPMQRRYGGCQPLIERMLSDAEQGNWEAAQLLALTLTAEAVGLKPAAD